MYLPNIADNAFALGYVSWIGKVAERDATLTEILIECGAVLYAHGKLHIACSNLYLTDLTHVII